MTGETNKNMFYRWTKIWLVLIPIWAFALIFTWVFVGEMIHGESSHGTNRAMLEAPENQEIMVFPASGPEETSQP